MNEVIYDKTDKGREEISTRVYHLAPRLRSLLVIIDGKETTSGLLKKILGLGLNEQHIQELLDQGFIATYVTQVIPAPTLTAVVAVEVPPPVTATANDLEQELPPAVDQEPTTPNAVKTAAQEAQQFQAVYTFFNETVKSTLGLRGFTLQLKVERASTLHDFMDLRQPFIEAVLKAKGRETTISLSNRLDQLLEIDSRQLLHKLINGIK